jgi:hypothetical protein
MPTNIDTIRKLPQRWRRCSCTPRPATETCRSVPRPRGRACPNSPKLRGPEPKKPPLPPNPLVQPAGPTNYRWDTPETRLVPCLVPVEIILGAQRASDPRDDVLLAEGVAEVAEMREWNGSLKRAGGPAKEDFNVVQLFEFIHSFILLLLFVLLHLRS